MENNFELVQALLYRSGNGKSSAELEYELKTYARDGNFNGVILNYEQLYTRFVRGKKQNNTMLRETMGEALQLCVHPQFAIDKFEDRVRIVAFLLNPGSVSKCGKRCVKTCS